MPSGSVALARRKLAPWLLLQPLDRMEPGQNTESDVHGNSFEDIQTPLVPEWVAVDAQGELDHAEDGPGLYSLV